MSNYHETHQLCSVNSSISLNKVYRKIICFKTTSNTLIALISSFYSTVYWFSLYSVYLSFYVHVHKFYIRFKLLHKNWRTFLVMIVWNSLQCSTRTSFVTFLAVYIQKTGFTVWMCPTGIFLYPLTLQVLPHVPYLNKEKLNCKLKSYLSVFFLSL